MLIYEQVGRESGSMFDCFSVEKKDWGIVKWRLFEPGNWMNRSDMDSFNMDSFCFAWSWMTSSRCQWLHLTHCSLVESHHFAKVADFQLRPWCWLKESDISGFLNRIDAGLFQGFPSKSVFCWVELIEVFYSDSPGLTESFLFAAEFVWQPWNIKS